MLGRFDTIRARIMIGLALPPGRLIATPSRRRPHYSRCGTRSSRELDELRGPRPDVVTVSCRAWLEEIRSAEQYLGSPGYDLSDSFHCPPPRDAFSTSGRLDAEWHPSQNRRRSPHVNRREGSSTRTSTGTRIAHALRPGARSGSGGVTRAGANLPGG